jgi:preprotein translocase subunit SecF
MNEVLMRSLNTSFVAILPILSLLVLGVGVLGAKALADFGLALFIGLLTGAYSSIFVASPLLAILKEREPQWQAVRERVLGRTGGTLSLAGAAAARADVHAPMISDGSSTVRAVFDGAVAPRGRKLGKKR